MEWRHSISFRPKVSECKNSLENFSPWILESRPHPPSRLSCKEPNYQRGVLLILAGAIEGHFEEKTHLEFHHDNDPAFRSFATQKKLAYMVFHWLDHPPYSPVLAPSEYHLFRGLEKRNHQEIHTKHFKQNSSSSFSLPLSDWRVLQVLFDLLDDGSLEIETCSSVQCHLLNCV